MPRIQWYVCNGVANVLLGCHRIDCWPCYLNHIISHDMGASVNMVTREGTRAVKSLTRSQPADLRVVVMSDL
jgi:hypothetical protein